MGREPKASEMAAYHKTTLPCLGVSNPEINDLVRAWQAEGGPEDWLRDAAELWNSGVFEARIAAGKLLTKARIKDDAAVWAEICRWVPQFDGWAIADHACKAGERRLVAHPERLDEVEKWTGDPSFWVRRAALVITLPWAKLNNPKPADLERRERVLGWAASYVDDPEWFIQKAISWWLRTLSARDPDRVQAFMAEYGDRMKPFARKDAVRNI
jgi:3-methyladenine DNA glycosylase AlkD